MHLIFHFDLKKKDIFKLLAILLVLKDLGFPAVPSGYRTASVIIALTDGELRENQFDLAQREVTWKQVWPSSKKTYVVTLTTLLNINNDMNLTVGGKKTG